MSDTYEISRYFELSKAVASCYVLGSYKSFDPLWNDKEYDNLTIEWRMFLWDTKILTPFCIGQYIVMSLC